MEKIRSFIAIELSEELKQALHRLQEQLKSGQVPAKWVDPDSMHLTLKFLGNINTEKIESITVAMSEAVKGIHPAQIASGKLGVFPNPRRVQIVWVGLNDEVSILRELHQRIETNFKPLGFTAETRPFTPHLTLARVRDYATPEQRQTLGRLITSTDITFTHRMNIDSVHLMKSQLTPGGAIYTKISTVTLD